MATINVDWSKPDTISATTARTTEQKARDDAQSRLFNPPSGDTYSLTDLPTGAVRRFASGSGWKFQEYNGSTWDDLPLDAANALLAASITPGRLAAQGAQTAGTSPTFTLALTGYALTNYVPFIVKFHAAASAAATLNVNSTGAKSIYRNGAAVSSTNPIVANEMYLCCYDGTQFQLLENKIQAYDLNDQAVTNDKLRDSAATSVIGRSANSTGAPADISATSDGQVLILDGTTLKFDTLKTASIPDGAVTLDKLNIAGGADIGADLADSDTMAVSDASASNANRKFSVSRLWTYISGKITGAVSTVLTSNLTASRAVVSNASGKLAVSAVTSTEIGYLDGVTSAIQTQLDAKAPLASGGSASLSGSNPMIFTSVPAWPVKRVTLMFNGVELPGSPQTAVLRLRTASGAVTTGYSASCSRIDDSVTSLSLSTGFRIITSGSASLHGAITLTRYNTTSDRWYASGVLAGAASFTVLVSGSVNLGGELVGAEMYHSSGSFGGDIRYLFE